MLMYAHSTMDMGHLMRQSAIARQIKAIDRKANVIIVSGAQHGFEQIVPPDVEYVKLPSMTGSIERDSYVFRPARLTLPFDKVLAMRKDILHTVIESFRPTIIVVDHNPSGLHYELQDIITSAANERGTKQSPVFVLGMRDIVNDPIKTSRFLLRPHHYELLSTCYDHIFVYGDRSILDAAHEYQLPDHIARKIEYVGYVYPRSQEEPSARTQVLERLHVEPGERLIFAAVGGGTDGLPVLQAAVETTQALRAEFAVRLYVTTGPYMSAQNQAHICELIQDRPYVTVSSFEADFVSTVCAADLFIGRCGYNTTLEVLCCGTPASFVPREAVEREQLERARRLTDRGFCTFVRECDLESGALVDTVRSMLSGEQTFRAFDLPLTGARHAARRIVDLAKAARPRFFQALMQFGNPG